MLTVRPRRDRPAAGRALQAGRMPVWAMLALAAMIVITVIELVALMQQ